MSVSIIHSEACSICKKEVVDRYGIQSSRKRCIKCREVFFVCGYCLESKCPNCGESLVKKSETFPDNLFLAIKNNNFEEVKYICNHECTDINDILFDNGCTPLCSAAVEQQYEICEYLINEWNASIQKKGKYGRTALIEMVRCRSSKWNNKITELLQESVNCQDNDGRTALMFASIGAGLFGSKKGNLKIANQLIDMGADTTILDNHGKTALYGAIKSNESSKTSNNEEMIAFLKAKMIQQNSIREFNKIYSYQFIDGALILEKR